jgi:hypothetical protein
VKEKYRWFEFNQYRSFCPHCEAEIALESKFQRWGLFVLPAIVLFVWDVALSEQGGVNNLLFYGSMFLAVPGIVMMFLKRKLVVVNPPSNNGLQSDAAPTRD